MDTDATSSDAAPPRVLFVGHTTYDLPLRPPQDEKWAAVGRRIDFRVVAVPGRVDAPDRRFRLLAPRGPRWLRGARFYASIPRMVRAEIAAFRPDVIVAQSPFEGIGVLVGRRLSRSLPRVVVEVHGDPASAARLYGSRLRALYAPLADVVARVALRRADGTRALTGYTAGLARRRSGREPVAVFPTFFDASTYAATPPTPLPEAPVLLWVGVLQRYKNPDGFARAWHLVADRVPEARLVMVGSGPMQPVVDELIAAYPGRVSSRSGLSPRELVKCFDAATALVLPSRSEGMGRVVIEAFLRGRPVVAAAVGGIPDLVVDGHNGLLVEPGDERDLADALVKILTNPELAARFGRAGRRDATAYEWTASAYADALRHMVDAVLGVRPPSAAGGRLPAAPGDGEAGRGRPRDGSASAFS